MVQHHSQLTTNSCLILDADNTIFQWYCQSVCLEFVGRYQVQTSRLDFYLCIGNVKWSLSTNQCSNNHLTSYQCCIQAMNYLTQWYSVCQFLHYHCIELTLRTDKKRMESDLVTMTKHLASVRGLLADCLTVFKCSLSVCLLHFVNNLSPHQNENFYQSY